jgi:hypothetical protein
MMIRIAVLGTLFLAAASAQAPAPDSLDQAVQRTTATWRGLATTLDSRVARLLPCDPKTTAAITEVSTASENRLSAVADYMRAAVTKASAATAAARQLLAADQARTAEIGAERSDTATELTAVEAQAVTLSESAKKRPPLDEPAKQLQQIATLVRDRVTEADLQSSSAAEVAMTLRDLLANFEARETAVKAQAVALEAERARWNVYYSARLARAHTECSIVNLPPAKPAPGKKP